MNAQEVILKISQLSFNGGDLKLDILNILNSVSVYATGDLTILYSGKVDRVSTGEIIPELINNNGNIRALDKTEAYKVLTNSIFRGDYPRLLNGMQNQKQPW